MVTSVKQPSILGGSTTKQSGAALIVALIILAVISVIGMANMQSTTLEMRMTGSLVNRNESFAMAEAALLRAENELATTMAVRQEDLYTDSCSTGQCFTPTCTAGLCFDGTWLSTDLQVKLGCEVASNAATVERSDFWKDDNIWSDANLHRVASVRGTDVKYIYEFLCFVETDLLQPTVGKPLFRITAYLESQAGRRAPIMLQTTYSLPW